MRIRKMIAVSIDPKTHRKLKIKAVRLNMTLSKLFIDSALQYDKISK